MENATITFPMFGSNFAVSIPNTYTLFGHVFHWYGAIIALGFVLAYFYVTHRVKDFGMTADDIVNMLICAVPSAVVGARLYYVVFNYSLFKDNLADIFRIWTGGLAIYGAVIGALIAVKIFCKVKKTSFGAYLDIGSFGLLVGQVIGRWGNFINREAHGTETTIFCRMGITDASGVTTYFHPTFLYESLWNALGFMLLHIYSKKGRRSYDGEIFAMYVSWYGFGRMLIEGLRTDSLYLFNTGLRVSQVLAAATAAIALAYLIFNRFRPHERDKMLVSKVNSAAGPSDTASGGVTDSDK